MKRTPAVRFTWPVLGLLVAAASCGVDDRSLSFQLALGSAPAAGAEAGASGDAAGGSAGDSPGSQGGQPNVAGGGGGEAGAGAGAPGNSSGAGPTLGGAPSVGGMDDQAGVSGNSGSTSTAGSSGSGGTSSAGNGGSAGSAGTGGGGGSAGDSSVEPGNFPCGNLNRNDVDDCTETLVTNSRFDTTATGWDGEGSLTETWKADNARGGSASGSLSLTNSIVVPEGTGKTALASHQCIVAWGGDQFELGARVYIASGQGGGSAGVNLLFYGSDGCDGAPLGGQDVALTSDTDRWVVVRGKLSIPAGTRSARVRLTVAKPFAQASLEAQFDDVLVVKQ